jgi:hypothetical protein
MELADRAYLPTKSSVAAQLRPASGFCTLASNMASVVARRLSVFLLILGLARLAVSGSGDDFSNNLFSDLGPVLALFGEQVAIQFMSQSMGWADSIIFAILPLGIITAIVIAIRVGGPEWLKAIIGRARESKVDVQIEAMSCTSAVVGEMWNGQAVVKINGKVPVLELIYYPATDGAGSDDKLFTLKTGSKFLSSPGLPSTLFASLANFFRRTRIH